MFRKWLNKIEDRIIKISGQDYTPRPLSLEWVLVCLSRLYGAGVGFRLWLYQKKIFRQKKLPCFVISIGNIVAGGSGKTPMTQYLAELLKKIGKKPVVISRGYKGRYNGDVLIVSDGHRIFSSAEESGDEPFMMATRLSFPVVVGKDRFNAGLEAMAAFNPDVAVLDDGFQHVRLKRNLDILLFDFKNPLENKRMLPAGRLRETLQTSGKRADAVVFTRCPEKNENGNDIDALLQSYPDRPVFKTFHKPYIRWWVKKDRKLPEIDSDMDVLPGKKAVLFSGLARNRAFYDSMADSGINILYHLEFKDHHRYKTSDFLMINSVALKQQADFILTTEKDWVKIGRDIKWETDFLVIGIRMEFEYPEKFEDFLVTEMEKK
ncbi:MAG: tetraacyldisaccharide 4'-kinase [Desulfobacula sp.]